MNKIVLSLLAIILIIEEWLWDGLTAFGQWLTRWLNLDRFDRWLSQTSPTAALIAFIIPVLVVMPFSLAALELLVHGLILQSILLEILAKLLGTLLIARVFALTKPQLLTFPVLVNLYNTIMRWLHWAHQIIAETTVYRLTKPLIAELKARFTAWFN